MIDKLFSNINKIIIFVFQQIKNKAMLIVISPAKTLDFETPSISSITSEIAFAPQAQTLIEQLRTMSAADIAKMMGISDKLAQLNFERFHTWNLPFTAENAKQALLAFKGDVYTGIDADTFSEKDFAAAQKQLRILSGLYGVLKPMDLIQPYRLEMGKKLTTSKGSTLYDFWGSTITDKINEDLKTENHQYLINLASNEYFKAIKKKKLQAEIISPVFKDFKNGTYKIISFYAKKARGLMTRFIIQNKITNPEELLAFESDGYYYNAELSKPNQPVFTRG